MLIDGLDQFLALRVFLEEPILNLHVETNHLQNTGPSSLFLGHQTNVGMEYELCYVQDYRGGKMS